MKRLVELDAVIDALEKVADLFPWKVSGNRDSYDRYNEAWNDAIGRAEIEIEKLPSAQRWIPCKTALPEINQRVILSLTDGTVMIGYQGEPDILWQVKDKRKKIWVYDPKSYTKDIDGLPTTKDCWFEGCNSDDMSYLSVTSPNYRKRFPGVIAWCPLPEPYKGHDDD